MSSCSFKKDFNRNSSEKQKIIKSISAEKTDREGKLVLGSLKHGLFQAERLLTRGSFYAFIHPFLWFIHPFHTWSCWIWCYQTHRRSEKRPCPAPGERNHLVSTAPTQWGRPRVWQLRIGKHMVHFLWNGHFLASPTSCQNLPQPSVGFVWSFVGLGMKARSSAGSSVWGYSAGGWVGRQDTEISSDWCVDIFSDFWMDCGLIVHHRHAMSSYSIFKIGKFPNGFQGRFPPKREGKKGKTEVLAN